MATKTAERRVLDDPSSFGLAAEPTPAPVAPGVIKENDDSITLPLLVAIPIYNERTRVIERSKELKFRKPTGMDLIEIGNPVEFDPISEPPKIVHNTPRMLHMMSRLSGVPEASLLKMEPKDLVSCFWLLTPFFIPRAGI